MFAPALLLAFAASLWGQAEYRVYKEHPRIWLDEGRLKRLTRDAERNTVRWQRLQQLVADDQTEERILALALTYRAGGVEAAGREAVELALTSAGDLRQRALVYDWCQPLLDERQREKLLNFLIEGIRDAQQRSGLDVAAVRDGMLAAIAASGDWDGAEAAIHSFFEKKWRGELLPALQADDLTREGANLIALLEMTHAVRDNFEQNLWTEAPAAFESFTLPRILSYTSETIQSPEGELRLSVLMPKDAADRAREAALWRIAEMLAVAYDPSARDVQFLQGWLRNDAYTLQGPLGALYEFLWVNPYLPGLSPTSGPKIAYDQTHSRIFARKGWEESDLWIGYYDGKLHLRSDGEQHIIEPRDQQAPLVFGSSAVLLGEGDAKYQVKVEDDRGAYPSFLYLVGLDPARRYQVRLNKDDWTEHDATNGGVIAVRNAGSDGEAFLDLTKPVRLQIRDAGARSNSRSTLGK